MWSVLVELAAEHRGQLVERGLGAVDRTAALVEELLGAAR